MPVIFVMQGGCICCPGADALCCIQEIDIGMVADMALER